MMLKGVKNPETTADSNRPTTPILKSRRSIILAHTPSSKLMIGKQESPYAQIQSLAKTRSTSNLKQVSQIKNISPNRIANYSIALKSTNSKRSLYGGSNSKHNSLNNSFHDPKDLSPESSAPQHKQARLLELKLCKHLENLHTLPVSAVKALKIFEIHKEVFDEIILKDVIFARVLKRIKDSYEDFIKSKDLSEQDKEYKAKAEQLGSNLIAQLDISKTQEKKIDKLLKENSELARALSRSEEICTEIQKKLCFITSYNVSEVPKDEMKWKALILENKTYGEAYGRLKEDIKNYRYKEKKLLQLIGVLKDKGYPVEKIYEEEIEKKKKPLPNYSGSEELESNSEAENLVSGRPAAREKPSGIPSLNFEQLKQETISSSSFDSQDSSEYIG